jgi:HEAT repeat protein
MQYHDFAADRDGAKWDLGVPVRLKAVEATAALGGPGAATALAEALDDPHAAVRLAAVEGIAAIGAPAAADRLVRCVVHWDGPSDHEAAALALQTLTAWKVEGVSEVFVDALTEEGGPEVEIRHREAFRELLASDPRGSLAADTVGERMIVALGTEIDDDRRARAEMILGWVGPSAADVVIEAIGSGRATPEAVRAAATLRDSRAVDPLIRLLDHPDEEMRRSAAIALEGLNDTRAVPALLRATQDPEQSVRDAASTALNAMGMGAVIVGLATVLRPHDSGLEPRAGHSPLLTYRARAGEFVNRLLGRGQGAARDDRALRVLAKGIEPPIEAPEAQRDTGRQ